MKLNEELKKYIENNIFPSYKKNDLGHNLDHIRYVIDRSLKFADNVNSINYNMVYVIAAYHDIGHYIDAKNHEKVSATMLLEDMNLKKFFTKDEIKTMSEAVYDHRASLEGEPRSIYGKIVSSADRNTLVEVPLKRTYAYRLEHNPNDSLDEIIEESRQHILNKFGKKGYATEKMYFEDLDYKKFLEEISFLADNKEEFKRKFIEVNGINN
ncbi:MAG: HD domain-containing protein [Bacilli bacterium]|nr:HD domain-containing protein [Bacilli bacterium]